MILYPEVVIEMPTVDGGSTGRRAWLQPRRYAARLTTRASAGITAPSARRHGPRGAAVAGVLAALLFASLEATGAQVPEPAPPRESFEVWLDALRKDALGAGIKPETVERALTTVEHQPTVLERDRGQAEFTLTLAQYLQRRLTPAMLRAAEARMREHRRLLARVELAHGVPAGIVLAVWALESSFGRFAGARPTVPVLATLAYDGRRAALFRSELLDALRILDRGDIDLERLKGSWAGALGQPQFLPSSYLKYAQDFDGDGRRDIWTSLPDVFASIAFYLKTNGWEPKQAWGRRVQVSDAVRAKLADSAPLRTTGCRAMRSLTAPLPLEQWAKPRRENDDRRTAASGCARRLAARSRWACVPGLPELRSAARLQLRAHLRPQRRDPRRSARRPAHLLAGATEAHETHHEFAEDTREPVIVGLVPEIGGPEQGCGFASKEVEAPEAVLHVT